MTNTGDTQVTDELIKELKTQHPGRELLHLSIHLEGEEFEMVVRMPSEGEYNRWREQRSSDEIGVKAGANRVLLATVRVWPEVGEYADIIKRRPGLTDTWTGEVTEAAGMARGARRKKL